MGNMLNYFHKLHRDEDWITDSLEIVAGFQVFIDPFEAHTNQL
jgi:hypothetical protein